MRLLYFNKKVVKILDDGQKDQINGISVWASSWEPRTKLIAAVLFIFGVISLNTLYLALIAYIVSFIVALCMGIAFIVLLKRYLIITPFLLLMTVPLLMNQSISLMNDHYQFAFLIIIKAFTSMTVITILLDTQSLEQFMNSLAHLKVPTVLITVLMLSYRYVFLFLEDIQKMQLAAKARFFNGGIGLKSLKTYGQLTGCLLIKSLDRSEHVYAALASRSFNGTLQFGSGQKISRADICKSLINEQSNIKFNDIDTENFEDQMEEQE